MVAWPEGEALIRTAEGVVVSVRKLRTRPVAEDWARTDRAIQRAVDARDLRRLNGALLFAMMRLPLLPRTKVTIMLGWGVLHGPGPVEVRELQRLAAEWHLGWRTVERGKARLRLKAIRQAGHWYWRRP